ncbi:uncharacterized protein LOC103717311 [Phoenix dactylifera]|uniref:Uncharacterized protein LOC103717311 n=1 Tax=Phoenix dactylifera TaxID=42345 RepID=A0A8B8ZLM8_PHODC|nr:uncharacterized protein LOC103717311 [Phoenix dactylifera]XP_038972368.1 uncharacterized protein LOC103717311 [Phoenix dactylifera]
MSLLHFPDAVNPRNLQIWNNAAFDDAAGGTVVAAEKLPWSALQPISDNQSESLDLDPCKENRSPSPVYEKTPVSKKSSTALKPAISGKASKVSFKEDAQINDESFDDEIEEIEKEIRRLSSRLEALRIKKAERDSRVAAARRHGRIVPAKFMDPKQNTMKILETPASKKIAQSPSSAKLRQRCGSLGPLEIIASSPKVLDLKQSSTKSLGSSSALKKIEQSPASARLQRRGVSLGPLEIHESVRSRQLKAPEGTPLRSVQIHKKQGLWKLEGIQEENRERRSSPKSRPSSAAKASVPRKGATATIAAKKVAESPTNARFQRRGVSLGPSEIVMSARSCQTRKIQEVKEKRMKAEKGGRSLSVSPKSQRSSVAAKVSDLRKGIATVGAKKPVKKEEGSLASLKPKVLFHEGKITVPAKRPSKNSRARVVASRYSLAITGVAGDKAGSSRRKWSLPELGMDETNGSLQGSHGTAHESQEELDVQMKRGEEMSSKVEGNVDHLLYVDENSPPSIMKIAELLPKIKKLRCVTESPRDSGRAKRVAELVGKRSVFGEADDEDVTSPCQALTFEEEE